MQREKRQVAPTGPGQTRSYRDGWDEVELGVVLATCPELIDSMRNPELAPRQCQPSTFHEELLLVHQQLSFLS